MPDIAPFQVSLTPIGEIDALEPLWLDLQSRSDSSWFTSWGWIGCWLRQLPARCTPHVLKVNGPAGIVGLGLLNRRIVRRGQIIASRGLFLHETGERVLDTLTVEHNGLLADRDHADAASQAALNYLRDDCPGWDELFLSGLDADGPLDRAAATLPGVRRRLFKQPPCHFVDLAGLRASGVDSLAIVGPNTRGKIRKSIRLFERSGPVALDLAATVKQGLQFFEAMTALHQASWQGKGEEGAFVHPCICRFHRALIESRLPHGEIQLLRVRAGDETLGYLYNFVHAGRVYAYQSGFRQFDDAKLKPGLMAHTLAIQYNQAHGANTYDFLAGDYQYKESLSNAATSMHWIVLQKRRARFHIEDVLRTVKRKCGL